MSLNRILCFLLVLLCCGCVQSYPEIKKSDLVNFKVKPGAAQLKSLEKYIESKRSHALKSIVLIYNNNNKNEAYYINSMMKKYYGIPTVFRFQPGNNEHVSVLLEYGGQGEGGCYQYSLSDFEWYRSSARSLARYTNATICDIVQDENSTGN